MTDKLNLKDIIQRKCLMSDLRLLSIPNLVVIFLMSMLISCGDEEPSGSKADIVIGEYEGLLYTSKPLEPLDESDMFPGQTVKVTKVRTETYRLSSTNPNIPTFDFSFDHTTTNSTGVIYNEYYFTIAAQTNNGVSVQANTLVFDKDNPGLGFSVTNGNGDTRWLFNGQKK